MSESPNENTAPAKKAATKKAPARKTTAKKAPAKKAPAKKTTAKKTPARKTTAKKAPAKKTTAKKAPARKTPASSARVKRTTPTRTAPPGPATAAVRKSAAERAVDVGAQAVGTAALVQRVAQETAERVAAETAARVSSQYEAAISELTRTLDKNTKRALKSVRAAADLAQSANPVKAKKAKEKK
jgi:hypothetical protein